MRTGLDTGVVPKLVLHPRASSSSRLQIWIGAFDRVAAPELNWTVDGQPREALARRPLTSARTAEMVANDEPRAFTGIYEFQGDWVQPDRLYRVRASAGDGGSAELRVRTLPEEVPRGADRRLNVLLVSCFHAAEDKKGLAGTLVNRMPAQFRPHLSLLLGDQVYLDLPTLQNFRDDIGWLAGKFETDYRLNWSSPQAYANVLQAAPSVSLPDDHEYWNNYPHPATVIQNSWKGESQQRWREAAKAMYEAFQLPYGEQAEESTELDIAPLSFFLMDLRTFRDEKRKHAASKRVRDQFQKWVQRVLDDKLYGIVASGQSFFDEPVSKLTGTIADWTLPNYEDFPQLVAQLARLADAGRPLLLVTGDVHWGRLLETKKGLNARPSAYEVISSPTSLVTTIGSDQLKTIRAGIGGFLGFERDRWPRHSEPGTPPAHFAKPQLGNRFFNQVLHGQKGNQAVVLSFRQSGGGLKLLVTFWEIVPGNEALQPNKRVELTLRATA